VPATKSPAAIPTAARVHRFTYAIRAIVAEAQRVEAAGTKVRYLNIGDPVAFGFKTPPHLVDAVDRAMRDGRNTYGPSAGIAPAREAVAAEYTRNGFPVSPDRVLITAGTSEGIDLALGALVEDDGEVLVPMPTYPLYTAVLAKLGARALYYRADPSRGWMPDLDHLRSLVTSNTRALVIIDPNNPTGAVYSRDTRAALLDFADHHGLAILADEVYGDLGFDGPVEPLGILDADAPIISFSSLSKAYLAPGWRTGWMAIGRSPRLDAVLAAVRKLADGRLCSTVPMQYAIAPALNGDRSHQAGFREALRAREADGGSALRDAGRQLRSADSGVLRDAEDQSSAGKNRRRLRAVAAARHGRALRLRLRLRAAERGRIPPHRLPRLARRVERDLRPDGAVHRRLSQPLNCSVPGCRFIAQLKRQ
jgi:alanine-synthesizing transaminase